MSSYSITHEPNSKEVDALRINIGRGKIQAKLGLIKFRDKDTSQWVYFLPELDITGYGENEAKASEMLKFSINDYFNYLIKLSSKHLEQELSNLGWKQDRLQNKKYSKAYVDLSGELKNFNAVDNKIERLTLEAV